MTQLEIESNEINGARKLLETLEHDWAFSMIPSIPMKCRSKVTVIEGHDYFPLPTKYRKLSCEAMVRFLLESKDNMRKFMYEQCELVATYEYYNKGGNVKRINTKSNG